MAAQKLRAAIRFKELLLPFPWFILCLAYALLPATLRPRGGTSSAIVSMATLHGAGEGFFTPCPAAVLKCPKETSTEHSKCVTLANTGRSI